ncbi:MAG: AAA family ATPase [Pseudomonadales bacterium]|nr:AAA family ATPase [Pseudomonadales bacterium]
MLGPMEDNFLEIARTSLHRQHDSLLEETRTLARVTAEALRALMARRLTEGRVRECHGDLHLANLALIEGEVSAFDCLEFNANLRWIDTMSDVAFLFMDCHVRDRQDLAYGFLDGYLDESGDYEGAGLLGYFCAYRSMVRAKVAALRHEQSRENPSAAQDQAQRCLTHILWARRRLDRPRGRLVLMCGLSGSGKSHLAGMLVTELPALRLRSDVVRKVQAGLTASSHSQSPTDAGLYEAGKTERVYAALGDAAMALLETGEHVILDATFIEGARRRQLLERAAALGVRACVLYCTAPVEVLRERISAREAAGADPSEATLEVLDRQIERHQPPGADEPAITVDMGSRISTERVRALAAQVLQQV